MSREFPMQADVTSRDGHSVFIEPRADGSADFTIEFSREVAETFASAAERDGKTWRQFGTEIMFRAHPDAPYKFAELVGMAVEEAIGAALNGEEE